MKQRNVHKPNGNKDASTISIKEKQESHYLHYLQGRNKLNFHFQMI